MPPYGLPDRSDRSKYRPRWALHFLGGSYTFSVRVIAKVTNRTTTFSVMLVIDTFSTEVLSIPTHVANVNVKTFASCSLAKKIWFVCSTTERFQWCNWCYATWRVASMQIVMKFHLDSIGSRNDKIGVRYVCACSPLNCRCQRRMCLPKNNLHTFLDQNIGLKHNLPVALNSSEVRNLKRKTLNISPMALTMFESAKPMGDQEQLILGSDLRHFIPEPCTRGRGTLRKGGVLKRMLVASRN